MIFARFRPVLPAVLAGALVLAPAAAFAQAVETGAPSAPVAPNAEQTRRELMAVLKQYPPTLGSLFRLDPNLMSNDQFMQPYPNLVAFLNKHPEIRRSPSFFFSDYYSYGGYRSEATQMWEGVMAGVAVFVMTVTMLYALGWIVRTLIDYRRWHRLTKTQSEVHAKILDRFSGNQELLAYVQSAAGSRFLSSAPITLDPVGGSRVSAPFARILWSVQAGLVLAAAGIGLYYVSGQVDEEVTQPLFTLGIVAMSLGAGFVVSAFVSFFLSRQLGLFNAPPAPLVERRDTVL